MGSLRTNSDITERKRAEQELAESEARFRALAESSPLAIFVSRDKKVVLANPACAKLFGAPSPENLIGKTALDLFDPASRSLVRERIRVDSEEVPLVEVRILRLDGTPVDVEATASPFLDQGVKAIQVLLRDITERKQAEEGLAESEARYRLLTESSQDLIFIIDRDDRVRYVNSAAAQALRRSPGDVVGRSRTELFDAETSAAMGLSLDRAFESGESMHAESELTYPSGSAWIATMLVPIKDNDNVTAVFGVSRDITERKRAEQELAESEARFRALAESSPLAIFVNRNDKVFLANPACAKLFGASSPEDLLGKTALDLFDPASRSLVRERIRVDSEEVPLVEVRILRLDGTPVDVEATASPFLDQGVKAIQVLLRDITERKRAEEALHESEKRYRTLVESAHDWVWEVGERGVYTFASQQVFDILGYRPDELLGKTPFELMPPDEAQRVGAQFAAIAEKREAFRNLVNVNGHKDGRLVILETNGVPIFDVSGDFCGYRGTDRDITERTRAEELAARQAERIKQTLTSVVDVTSNIVELRDPYTAGHQRRVTELAVKIAESLGLSGHEIDDIRVAGLLHDMGKAGVPTEILSKPGQLSPVEFELVKGHGEAGYRLAVSAQMAEPVAQMIHQHHERCDGSGYPQGLTGDQTLLGAKVLAVADVVEAMTSYRPYRFEFSKQ